MRSRVLIPATLRKLESALRECQKGREETFPVVKYAMRRRRWRLARLLAGLNPAKMPTWLERCIASNYKLWEEIAGKHGDPFRYACTSSSTRLEAAFQTGKKIRVTSRPIWDGVRSLYIFHHTVHYGGTEAKSDRSLARNTGKTEVVEKISATPSTQLRKLLEIVPHEDIMCPEPLAFCCFEHGGYEKLYCSYWAYEKRKRPTTLFDQLAAATRIWMVTQENLSQLLSRAKGLKDRPLLDRQMLRGCLDSMRGGHRKCEHLALRWLVKNLDDLTREIESLPLGLVHLDLKPEHIYCQATRMVVLDWDSWTFGPLGQGVRLPVSETNNEQISKAMHWIQRTPEARDNRMEIPLLVYNIRRMLKRSLPRQAELLAGYLKRRVEA